MNAKDKKRQWMRRHGLLADRSKKKNELLRKTDNGIVYQFPSPVFTQFNIWCSQTRGESMDTPGFTEYYRQLGIEERGQIEVLNITSMEGSTPLHTINADNI